MKAEGVGLVGSVLITTGTVVVAGVEGMAPAWAPCKSTAEEPPVPVPAAEEAEVASGGWAGRVAAEVALATGDCRPGNMASPGVEDLCAAGAAGGA